MIVFKNVTLRNFLSVGQITQAVDLSAAGLALVLGNNHDMGDPNARNGCGKSTIIQAISFVLYGEPLANIRIDNLINNINIKSMLVTINFERDGKSYRIERGRKPNLLRFFVNDNALETNNAEGENKQTQLEINRVVGMSHLLFTHLVAMNTYTEPFLRLKPAPQREIIEELLGITQLSLRDEALVEIIKATKKIITEEDALIKATAEANSRITKAIERVLGEQEKWATLQESKIAVLATEINNIDDVDFDSEIKIFDEIDNWKTSVQDFKTNRTLLVAERDGVHREIKSISTEIKRQQDQGVSSFDTQISRLQRDLIRCQADAKSTPDSQVARLHDDVTRREKSAEDRLKLKDKKEHELTEILSEIDNSDEHTCSSCGQGLTGTDHLQKVIDNLNLKASAIRLEILKCCADAETFKNEAADIHNEIEQIKLTNVEKQLESVAREEVISKEIKNITLEHQEKKKEIESHIVKLQNQLSIMSITIAELETAVVSIDFELSTALSLQPISNFSSREDIWKLREEKDNLMRKLEREIDAVNPHDVNVTVLESTIKENDYTKLHDTQLTLKHQEFLHKLLSGKDSFVRKKIIDQNLSYLNVRMNSYLESLGLPHEVKFMPDLSVDISEMGRDYDFEQLSRGERSRVILATSWAFRDVWESMNTSMNLLLLDEVVDVGFDPLGLGYIVEILKKMVRERGKNVFVISHHQELISQVDRILMVHKENKFTRFEDNAEIS